MFVCVCVEVYERLGMICMRSEFVVEVDVDKRRCVMVDGCCFGCSSLLSVGLLPSLKQTEQTAVQPTTELPSVLRKKEAIRAIYETMISLLCAMAVHVRNAPHVTGGLDEQSID